MLPSLRSSSTLRTVYDRLAPLYDSVVPVISRTPRILGESWLQPQKGDTILHVGVGTGQSFCRLSDASRNGWSEGIDVSPQMLARARQRMQQAGHRRYGLRLAGATSLPYPSDTFDALFCSYTIDVVSVRDRRRILREIRRVLTATGRAVFVHLSPPQTLIEHVWACMFRLCPVLAGGARPIHLRAPLQRLGFHIRKSTSRTQAGVRSSVTLATLD